MRYASVFWVGGRERAVVAHTSLSDGSPCNSRRWADTEPLARAVGMRARAREGRPAERRQHHDAHSHLQAPHVGRGHRASARSGVVHVHSQTGSLRCHSAAAHTHTHIESRRMCWGATSSSLSGLRWAQGGRQWSNPRVEFAHGDGRPARCRAGFVGQLCSRADLEVKASALGCSWARPAPFELASSERCGRR